MSSEQIYYTYYSPTDWQHLNKVKYTENLSNAGDLLVTSSSGFENLNARRVIARNDITSSWGAGIQKQNDFNYNVSVTNGFKFNSSMVNNIQVVSASSNIANTIAKQITIDDFDYDTIFGLTRANPNVIDYNWYSKNNGKNIFDKPNDVTNKETTRIGPKLFVYGGTSEKPNNYNTGNIAITLNSNTATVNTLITNTGTNSYNYTSNYIDKTIRCGDTSCKISLTTPLIKAETAWPYKIQYNANQWYHILTNGQKSALLTLPYWDPTIHDVERNDPERYYVLNVRNDQTPNSNPIYSYYKLDKIVENNYYYITSYFDTRPTIMNLNTIHFNSNSSSLFNENTIQVLPLISYNYDTFFLLHRASTASCVASCVPVSYTTSKEPKDPFINSCYVSVDGKILQASDSNTINYEKNNFGLNPIEIKYEKNITITTTINYTVANMTNLGNILTGWNYLPKNFINLGTDGYNSANNYAVARANLPYINAGIIIYIPTENVQYTKTTDNGKFLNNDSAFIRFRNWIEAFGFGNFYSKTTEQNASDSQPQAVFNEKFVNIYNTILTNNTNMINVGEVTNITNTNKNDPSNFFYTLSTPAFINFNTLGQNSIVSNDHLDEATAKYDFLDLMNKENGDPDNILEGTIKFVNTLCMPINNAINTTHTATDNFTFRLQKLKGTTDYIYIIGIYFYITKGVPFNVSNQYPHYLGFSPSTNIAPYLLMSENGGEGSEPSEWNGYLYPNKIIRSFLCDSTNYKNIFNGVNFPKIQPSTQENSQNALMKDIFITPSLYMTINESVGDV